MVINMLCIVLQELAFYDFSCSCSLIPCTFSLEIYSINSSQLWYMCVLCLPFKKKMRALCLYPVSVWTHAMQVKGLYLQSARILPLFFSTWLWLAVSLTTSDLLLSEGIIQWLSLNLLAFYFGLHSVQMVSLKLCFLMVPLSSANTYKSKWVGCIKKP